MPTEPPDCEKIAALIPTAWPWALMSGPPPKNCSKDWLLLSTRLVLMLTTAGLSVRASSTHGDAAGAGAVVVTGRSLQSAAPTWVKPNRGSTATSATARISAVISEIFRLIGHPFHSAPVVRFRRAGWMEPAAGLWCIRGPCRRSRRRAEALWRGAGGSPPSAV